MIWPKLQIENSKVTFQIYDSMALEYALNSLTPDCPMSLINRHLPILPHVWKLCEINQRIRCFIQTSLYSWSPFVSNQNRICLASEFNKSLDCKVKENLNITKTFKSL